jgi:RNA polymerase sigma-70 factor (ECF subfamily)
MANGSIEDEVAARAPVPPLREVYRAHGEFVWRALRALGVRDADLDDQTQEVFIVVSRKLTEFEGRSKLTTWLFGIATLVASNYRRIARVRREQIVDPMHHERRGDDSAVAPPEQDLERRQARAALNEILDGMPPEQRVVFALFELDGMAADEIAGLVAAPVNTVYSRLRLARQHFERAASRLRARGVY